MEGEKKKKRSFEDQLRITDRASCENAIRNGGVAAMRGAYLWHSRYRHEAAPEAAS
jgi:hypothetical protein